MDPDRKSRTYELQIQALEARIALLEHFNRNLRRDREYLTSALDNARRRFHRLESLIAEVREA